MRRAWEWARGQLRFAPYVLALTAAIWVLVVGGRWVSSKFAELDQREEAKLQHFFHAGKEAGKYGVPHTANPFKEQYVLYRLRWLEGWTEGREAK